MSPFSAEYDRAPARALKASVAIIADMPHCGMSGHSCGHRSTYPNATWYQDPAQYALTCTGVPSITPVPGA